MIDPNSISDEYVSYTDIKSELLSRLGFCGCGLPDESLNLINDLMIYIRQWNTPFEGILLSKEWEIRNKANHEYLHKIIASNYDGLCYVLFNLLADKNITRHGGSLPGWVEDYKFAEKLEKYINHINNEDED